MASKNEEAEKSVMEFEIKLNGLLTMELRGKVLTEIIKSLIYQRGQIPLPLDQLKRHVQNELSKSHHHPMTNKVFQDSPEGAAIKVKDTKEIHSENPEALTISNLCLEESNITVSIF